MEAIRYILLLLFLAVSLVKMAGMSTRPVCIIAVLMGAAAWLICHRIIHNGIRPISSSIIAALAAAEGIIICMAEIKSIDNVIVRKIYSCCPSFSVLFTVHQLAIWSVKAAAGWRFILTKILFAASIAIIMYLLPSLMRKFFKKREKIAVTPYELEIIIILLCIFTLN